MHRASIADNVPFVRGGRTSRETTIVRQSRRVAAVGVPVAAGAAVLALLGAGGGSTPLADPPQPVATEAGRAVDVLAVDDPAMPHPSLSRLSPPRPTQAKPAVVPAAPPERASRSDSRPTAPARITPAGSRPAVVPTSSAPRRTTTPAPTHRATAAPRPTATTTTSPNTSSTSTTSRDAFVARVLQLVNAQRTSHGLRPFTLSSCAGRFAQPWADHLAAAGTLSHQSLSTVLTSCSARTAGENVGYTSLGADDLVARWMASAPHRANILNPAFTLIGLGAARADGRWYGVQDFLG